MLYLHDVWVNWFEGEENGYNVCHFFEWRKEDAVELLDQVPLIVVPDDLFSFLENDLQELPKQLLEEIYQKAYIRRNHERVQLENCFVVTDGKGILAVDTIGYKVPVRKSRLIPRQEQMVYDMIENIKPESYGYHPTLFPSKEHHILSPSPLSMQGLTRRERQLKQLLFMTVDQLYSTKNVAEIRYWYTEWNPRKYTEIQNLDFDNIWGKLYMEIQDGWSDKHKQLCERLVRGQPFFERLWDIEHETKVN